MDLKLSPNVDLKVVLRVIVMVEMLTMAAVLVEPRLGASVSGTTILSLAT